MKRLFGTRLVVFSVVLLGLSGGFLFSAGSALADHGRGRGFGFPGGGWGGGRGGGFHYLDISPWGIGYGFQGRNFGIQVGPFAPRDFGPYYRPGTIIYDTPVDVAPAVVRPADEAPRPAAAEQALIETNEQAAAFQASAEEAFRAGRTDEALRAVGHALVEDPENGKLHLFASQVMFAKGDYQSAAVAIHQGVSLLERDDWGYVVKNYRRFYTGTSYVEQMDRLVAFIKENPDAAFARLVRGYQYFYLGHEDAARKELKKVVALESRDQVARQLLEALGGNVPAPVPPEEDR